MAQFDIVTDSSIDAAYQAGYWSGSHDLKYDPDAYVFMFYEQMAYKMGYKDGQGDSNLKIELYYQGYP